MVPSLLLTTLALSSTSPTSLATSSSAWSIAAGAGWKDGTESVEMDVRSVGRSAGVTVPVVGFGFFVKSSFASLSALTSKLNCDGGPSHQRDTPP